MITLQDTTGVRLPPPIYFAGAFAAGVLAQVLLPLSFPEGAARLVGAPVILTGLALIIWAVRRLWRAGTTIEPGGPVTVLVTDGPYRFSRNPIYLGYVVGYIGAALLAGTLWPLLLLPATVGMVAQGVIRKEEVYLERKFGDEYRAYKRRVRRWL